MPNAFVRMKKLGFIFCMTLSMVLAGCADTPAPMEDDPMQGTWNLLNISGGFAGMDHDFEKGSILWEFDPEQQSLLVINNAPSDAMYTGLDTASYKYSNFVLNGSSYLRINDVEFGGVTFSNSKMVVDQNLGSQGNGADGFVFVLER